MELYIQNIACLCKIMSICAVYKRACNLNLSVFDSQFLNSMELLNSCKHFVRLINLSSFRLKCACEGVIFIFLKINKALIRA